MTQFILILVLLSCMMVIVPVLSNLAPRQIRQPIINLIFIVYLIGNLYTTLLSRTPGSHTQVELELFRTFKSAFTLDYGVFETIRRIFTEGFPAGIRIVSAEPLKGALLNVLLYVPVGFLLRYVFPRLKGWHVIVIGIAASGLTEIIQWIFQLGWCDIDDLMNNTLGTILGQMLYAVSRRIHITHIE